MNAISGTPYERALAIARTGSNWTSNLEGGFEALYNRASHGPSIATGRGNLVREGKGSSPITRSASFLVDGIGELSLELPPTLTLTEADVVLTSDEVQALSSGCIPRLYYRRNPGFIHSAAGMSAFLATERAAATALCLWPAAAMVLQLHQGPHLGLRAGLECLRISGIWDGPPVANAIRALGGVGHALTGAGFLPETVSFVESQVNRVHDLYRTQTLDGSGNPVVDLIGDGQDILSVWPAPTVADESCTPRALSLLWDHGSAVRETVQDPIATAAVFCPDRVPVYTPQEDLVLLPHNATGLDLAFALHEDLLLAELPSVSIDGVPQVPEAQVPAGATAVLIAGSGAASLKDLEGRAVLVNSAEARSKINYYVRNSVQMERLETRLLGHGGAQPGPAARKRPVGRMNPYRPFNATGETNARLIYGRIPELRLVLRELENGNSVTVRGEKRAGKSTFGTLLIQALTHRHITVSVDMRRILHASQKGDVIGAMADEIAGQFSANTGVPYCGPERSLKDVMEFIEANQDARTTVLVIDEIRALVDALPLEDLTWALSKLEGALPPDCSPTQQVYIVHRDFERACRAKGISPPQFLGNYAQPLLIRALDEASARALVVQSSRGAMLWSTQALDRVIWWTGCYPEQIHGVCHNVFEDYRRLVPAASHVTAEMVDRAANEMMRSGVLDSRWEENSASQQLILAALANMGRGKGHSYAAIIDRLALSGVDLSPDELWPSALDLDRDGVLRLEITDGEPVYSFTSPLFEEYVRAHYRPGAILTHQ